MAWIRALGRDEFGFCFELAKGEGWNSGRYDAAPFFAADPEGFLVAHDDEGTKLGCISAVRYETFGFIGLFIVRPEFRGKGIGSELFAAALRHLDGLPVGLDAVATEEERYARRGFARAYTTLRFTNSEREGRDRFASGIAIEKLRVLDDDVVAYDRECFGSTRAAFLQAWVAQPDVVALLARSMSTRQILGYGVGREARAAAREQDVGADLDLDPGLLAAHHDQVLLDQPRHCLRHIVGHARQHDSSCAGLCGLRGIGGIHLSVRGLDAVLIARRRHDVVERLIRHRGGESKRHGGTQ